jgi:hypothetical protein
MKTTCTVLLFFWIQWHSHAQMAQYDSIILLANSHFEKGDYKAATDQYTAAFKTLGDKGMQWDRYQAAQAWSKCSQPDSAFFHLRRLQAKTEYLEALKLQTDTMLQALHTDQRWVALLQKLNPNNETYIDSLASRLKAIHYDDQHYRQQLDSLRNKFGGDSDEMQQQWKLINFYDSINLILVEQILDQHGWLSVNEVGRDGNAALWLTIQHAPLSTQEKYFPVMQQAVEKGKASPRNLAYLQDRILMRQGKKQLYGTQFQRNSATGEMKLWDIEEPERLNERRAKVGLPELKQ